MIQPVPVRILSFSFSTKLLLKRMPPKWAVLTFSTLHIITLNEITFLIVTNPKNEPAKRLSV
jgi:hypothetical protein